MWLKHLTAETEVKKTVCYKNSVRTCITCENVNKGESYKDAYFKLNNNIDLTEKY